MHPTMRRIGVFLIIGINCKSCVGDVVRAVGDYRADAQQKNDRKEKTLKQGQGSALLVSTPLREIQ